MADLFLSYRRSDRQKAELLVNGLRAAGVDVWWDQDIPPDAPWETTIEHELAAARAVIVAWSPAAVRSENVKAEARQARSRGKLIQVFVEPCEPPLFFGERQGIDLASWGGDKSDRRFQAVLAAVATVLDGKRPSDEALSRKKPRRFPLAALIGFIGAASGIGVLANFGSVLNALCATPWQSSECASSNTAPTSALPPDAATLARRQRDNLLAGIEGLWGNPAGATQACFFKIRYWIERRGADDIIRASSGDSFVSEARVASAEGSSIFTRTLKPVEQAGQQWELRLEADRLLQIDANNVGTTLVRCGD